MVTEVIVTGNARAKFKTSHVEGVLKMASSPLKRKAPLQENQPERKKSKLSNNTQNTFSYLNGKCFDNLLSNANIKIPYFRDEMAPETNLKI